MGRPVQREGTIAPDDIDERSAPRTVTDVLDVEVDGERLVIGGPWGGARILNPTGALMWEFLDGEASIDDLIDDFADATGTPRKVVRDDLLDFTRSLGRAGLLVDVEEPMIELTDDAFAPAVSFAVGDEVEPFEAPDLEGRDRSLADFRGRRVYLVNWNPGCGYCEAIAEALAGLEPGLAEAGVELVLVAGGDVESNRALADRAGLRAPVLVKGDGVEPFGGLGTPAAVLLDEEGRVADELAMGAVDVPKAAADVAGVELPAAADDASPDGTRYLSAASGMCGPGAASGSKTSWAGTAAFAFDDVHVGIRYNNDSTAALLEKLFVGARIDDPAAPDNYSVALTDPDTESRELELLVQGTQQLVRSRSKRRVLVGLLRHLSNELSEPDPSLLRVVATPAVDDSGRGLLLPGGLTPWLGKLQPRLARLGIRLADVPLASVDTATAELVVAETSIAHDPTVLEHLDDGLVLGRTELAMVEPGRYPLAAWYLPTWEDESSPADGSGRGLRPALAVASTVHLCADDDVAATVATLAPFVERVPVVPIHFTSAAELADSLRAH